MPDTCDQATLRFGVPLIICAPSGTGKTTLVQRLRQEFPNFAYSVSCTTRAPRGQEVDGKDYHFLSVEEFLRRRDAGAFAEWANVHGNYYGTPLGPVLDTLKAGRDLLFDIDVQGAAQLHLSLPRGVYVFLLPPSMSELERRLRGRGTDEEASIARRLANADAEIRQAHWFDAWIVNDDLDAAYDHLRAVYLAATLNPAHRPALALSILEG
ncbi:MAG TPA: guanylate kinase [Candidatus Bilophila faecipullorum]|uniref:Guanylate kinase n=1 Tax=Candidatus Bilophila faecipullorum TaxID=2838482 RepID=A0A9D1U937_9BACT|nr:guanylate kinase [uncultured Bilophila sp.]HIW78076.1 guanylate kinase [Candidatus Bilophila faecipullorum]